MRRMYPLYSLRDWRDACSRSQVRANRQRANEPFVPSWTEAGVMAALVLLLLWLAYVALPVAT